MYRRTKTISPIDESSPKKKMLFRRGGVDKYHAFAVCYNYECVGKAGVVRRGRGIYHRSFIVANYPPSPNIAQYVRFSKWEKTCCETYSFVTFTCLCERTVGSATRGGSAEYFMRVEFHRKKTLHMPSPVVRKNRLFCV